MTNNSSSSSFNGEIFIADPYLLWLQYNVFPYILGASAVLTIILGAVFNIVYVKSFVAKASGVLWTSLIVLAVNDVIAYCLVLVPSAYFSFSQETNVSDGLCNFLGVIVFTTFGFQFWTIACGLLMSIADIAKERPLVVRNLVTWCVLTSLAIVTILIGIIPVAVKKYTYLQSDYQCVVDRYNFKAIIHVVFTLFIYIPSIFGVVCWFFLVREIMNKKRLDENADAASNDDIVEIIDETATTTGHSENTRTLTTGTSWAETNSSTNERTFKFGMQRPSTSFLKEEPQEEVGTQSTTTTAEIHHTVTDSEGYNTGSEIPASANDGASLNSSNSDTTSESTDSSSQNDQSSGKGVSSNTSFDMATGDGDPTTDAEARLNPARRISSDINASSSTERIRGRYTNENIKLPPFPPRKLRSSQFRKSSSKQNTKKGNGKRGDKKLLLSDIIYRTVDNKESINLRQAIVFGVLWISVTLCWLPYLVLVYIDMYGDIWWEGWVTAAVMCAYWSYCIKPMTILGIKRQLTKSSQAVLPKRVQEGADRFRSTVRRVINGIDNGLFRSQLNGTKVQEVS